jgi:hypothetical protein
MYLLVRHVQHGEPSALQDSVAFGVVSALRSMHWPIDFNHRAGDVAIEVYNETIDDLLPPEVQASEAVGPEPLPKHLFLCRLISPQPPCLLSLLSSNSLSNNDVATLHSWAVVLPFPRREGAGG